MFKGVPADLECGYVIRNPKGTAESTRRTI
jgi:hypothetical protein